MNTFTLRQTVSVPTAIAVAVAAALALVLWPVAQRETTAGGWGALPAAAVGPVSAAVGRADTSYHVTAAGVSFVARNAANLLTARFARSGMTLRAGGASLGMRLVGAGDATPAARANRVSYRRAGLTEWYVNGPAGLEQGFTLSRRPHAGGGEVQLRLRLSGALAARARTAGGRVRFGPLEYGGLVATDAGGARLPARLSLDRRELVIAVRDRGARYPLTIDPMIELARLTASGGAPGDAFGRSVSVSGNTVVVGAPGANSRKGAAYVFVEPGSGWADASSTMTQTATLTPSDGTTADGFGVSVGISGGTVVVGADNQQVGSNPNQGEGYVFVEPGGGWSGSLTETAKLTVSGGAAFDSFGSSVAIDGGNVVVAADGVSSGQGAGYVFVKPGGGWATTSSPTATLTVSGGSANDALGFSAAISGSDVVFGAPGVNSGRGAAYVYVQPGGGWATTGRPSATLTASDGAANDALGWAVGVSGGVVVAGADAAAVGSNAGEGKGYVFVQPGGGWSGAQTESAQLTTSDGAAGDTVGGSVAIDGDTVVLGAPFATVGSNAAQGAAYVFAKPGGGWSGTVHETQKLTDSGGAASDELGTEVAANGGTVVAGASGRASGTGAAKLWSSTTAPGQPTGVAAAAGDARATVSWSAPASDGGARITGYTVTSSPDGKTCAWTSGSLSCTVTGLTDGTAYTFTVTATNSVGTGAPSAASSPVTPATTPGAPTGVSATIAGDGQVTVSWSAPSSNGGATITSYTVTAGLDGNTCTWTAGPLSCTVSGLTGGTSYTFEVTATNRAGTGATAASNSVTALTAPGAPTGLDAGAGDSQATVAWSAPSSDGGAKITGYTVTSSPDGKTCTWTSGPLGCIVTGLSNETAYTFTVTATNSVGGTVSSPSSAVTPRAAAPICHPGTYLKDGACTPADGGYFVNSAGATSETPCAAGTYSSGSGSSACTPAPAGSSASGPGPGGSEATSPTLCAAGSYSESPGAASCTPAPVGGYASGPGANGTGATHQTSCGADTYADQTGLSSCTACPSGTTTNGKTGSTQLSDCVAATTTPTKTCQDVACVCPPGSNIPAFCAKPKAEVAQIRKSAIQIDKSYHEIVASTRSILKRVKSQAVKKQVDALLAKADALDKKEHALLELAKKQIDVYKQRADVAKARQDISVARIFAAQARVLASIAVVTGG